MRTATYVRDYLRGKRHDVAYVYTMKLETAERCLLLLHGECLSLDTLRRRVRYGGRKGRRAARRLRAAGVRP